MLMRRWFASSTALLLASGGCRSREMPSDGSAGAPALSATAAPSGSARPMSGLPITLLKPEIVKFPLGDAFGARLGPRGWMSTKPGTAKDAYDLVFAPATDGGAPRTLRAPRPGQPHFVTTRTKAFVWYEEHDELAPQVFSLDSARAKLVEAAVPGEWAFDLKDGRTLLVGTRGGKMMIASRWHVSALGPDGPRVVSSTTTNESAWGAAALGDGFVIAVREPVAMAGATLEEKVSALQGVLRGDGDAMEALSEPARAALVYLDKDGRVTRREALGPQRPAGLATTDRGWLVVLCEGTLRRGFRDAVLIGRGPSESVFRVLASDLETPTGLLQHGSWSCLTELPSKDRGETYVVHCVDPERGIHVATPPIEGIVSINDIELGETRQVWISRHRYHGEPQDEVLTMTLP